MHLGAVAAQINDPEKLKLLKHKEDLEQSIDELKYQKASMDSDEYRQKLRAVAGRAGQDAGGAGQVKFAVVLMFCCCRFSRSSRRRNRACLRVRSTPAQCATAAPSRGSGCEGCYHASDASPPILASRRKASGRCAIISRQRRVSRRRQAASQRRRICGSAGAGCIWSIGSPLTPTICSRKRWRSTAGVTRRRCSAARWSRLRDSAAERRSWRSRRSRAIRNWSKRRNCWRASRSKTTTTKRPRRKRRRLWNFQRAAGCDGDSRHHRSAARQESHAVDGQDSQDQSDVRRGV